jgi:hypothetical protein
LIKKEGEKEIEKIKQVIEGKMEEGIKIVLEILL